MSYNTMKVEKAEGIAKIILDRPPMNVVNEELLDELVIACEDIENDATVQVVIITGAGRSFSAGRELSGILEGVERPGGPRYRSLENLSKPVIAAVNGFCFTGSFELAMCADIIIASDKSKFADTHARFGIIPGGGQTQRLPRLVGLRKAKELMWTCEVISAQEAERIGIVNRVVPADDLIAGAEEMARKILENIPETISKMKYLINHSQKLDLEAGLTLEASQHATGKINPTEEGRKRIIAFLEKS